MANDNDIVSVTPIAATAATPPTVHEDPNIVGVTPVVSPTPAPAPTTDAPQPTVATGDQDDILTRGLKQFGGDVAGAAGSTLGLLGNPINILLNKTGLPQALSGAPLSENLGQSAKDIAGGAIGKVEPQNEIDRLSDAITEGGLSSVIGGTGLGNALKNVASPVISGAAKALAESPVADLVSGVSGGASSEAARAAGAGPVGQTVAGLVGGGIGGLGAGLAHAGREAPVSDSVVDNTPAAITPKAQADFNTQLEEKLRSGASIQDLNVFASQNNQRLDPEALAAAVKAFQETGQTGGVVVRNPEVAPVVPQATPDAIQSGDEGQQIQEVAPAPVAPTAAPTPEAPATETPEAAPPTRREQIQAATQQLNDQSAPGKTAIVQPFPEAEPDYYRFQHTTKDGKTVSGTYTYNDDTNTIENLSVGDKNAGLTNSVGPTGVRNILKDLQAAHPDLQGIDGYRISGARKATGAGAENVSVPVRPQTPEDATTQAVADGLPVNRPQASETPIPAVEHPGDEVVQKLTKALNVAGKTRANQDAMYREARIARSAAIDAAGQGKKGEARLIAQKAAAKGELPKADFEDISQQFTSDEKDSLLDKVASAPNLRTFEKLRGQIALQKLLHGEVPQPSELGLLAKVFPTDFIRAAIKHKDTLAASFGKDDQNEMFNQGETLSSGPVKTLSPEPKAVDPDKFVVPKGQGDLFAAPSDATKLQGQGELFSGAETNSTGPVGPTLKPEPKAVDPDKFVVPKGQGDLFKSNGGPPLDDAPSAIKPPPPNDLVSQGHRALSGAAQLSRALMATLDFSAPLNQGVFLISKGAFWKSLIPMFKSGFSKAQFEGLQASIEQHPNYNLMLKSGLAVKPFDHGLSSHEEQFIGSHIAEKIPVFGRLHAGAERAYTGFLHKLRADTFNNIAQKYKSAGIDLNDPANEKSLADLASFVNNATGRGSLGSLEKHAGALSTAMFSPRLMASRVNLLNPVYYGRLDPIVRQEAIKSAIAFGGIALTVAGLLKANGANVGTNPLSSDFMKIKVGNTHQSIAGNFPSYITLAARLAMNGKVGADGQFQKFGVGYKPDTRLSTIGDFFGNKASPGISFVMDYLRGQDHDFQPFSWTKEIAQHFIPLFLQDVQGVIGDTGISNPAKKAALIATAVLGSPTNTYTPKVKAAKGHSAPAPIEAAPQSSTPTPTPSSDNDIVSVTPVQ